ncbi:MAG: phenylalanine--tRNA ligase subunit alpha [Candidatus Pacebacteria bacterium CG10_big_fil_rev_8_21_14_0_10_56_10]|nr:MAG: phenylalanine--tRNA ligase subunit alpha [Candidatus Pacebacteria bacterium CG10_big_fil_rev_8_21_14_0_10_56_10]
MKTKLIYLKNAYQQTLSATVQEVVEGKQTAVVLDQTIFYPQGGGQPSDWGVITGPNGRLEISHASYNDGEVLHKGKLAGELAVGDPVELELDWPRRYYHMQLHTAGHIVDQAVATVMPDNRSLDGNHGIAKRSYIAFEQAIRDHQLADIQLAVDKVIADDELVTAELTTLEELRRRQVKLPADLHDNKELRIVQIGLYPPMPDGGTHLKSTGESWPVRLDGVARHRDEWRLFYQVAQPKRQDGAGKTVTPEKVGTASQTGHGLPSLARLDDELRAVRTAFAKDTDALSAAELKVRYLGKKGAFNQAAKLVREVPAPHRPAAGKQLNQLKQDLESQLARLASRRPQSADEREELEPDLTMPGLKPPAGHVHPISQAVAEVTRIFERIGFTRVRYPEVDWDWYVFESLNMPPNHPARDEWETFFVDAPAHPSKGKVVLTTHTSNGQVREMERVGQPPIRMINISRCYRRQQDVTHTQMFHQFEGMVIDRGISIPHLKGTLEYFASEFYGPGAKSRIRPFHFQFTEPSFEVDFSCHLCQGSGQVTEPSGQTAACRFCKGGWHEVGGAGMVHPNVLKAGGIDPDIYTGFAFGWGVERTYTLKPGLNIDDIRLLYSADLRFLEQF